MTRAAFQLKRSAIGQHTTFIHHQHPTAQRSDLLQDMRGNDHDFVTSQALDLLTHAVFLIRIKTIRRFIEDQYFRVMHNRLRQTNTALKALGKGVDRLASYLHQLKLLKHGCDPRLLFAPAVAAHFGYKAQKLDNGHLVIAGGCFCNVTDHY
ncbi:hypothetical protein BOP96_17810 [Pseudomonas sp. FSL W5-0203]|nr:hypothetical protein BOP96_17810 [Pseudomonas sp. FSL W5-0203]